MRRRRSPALVLLLAVVAGTVLAAAPASAGGGCHVPATEGSGTTLALTDLCFSPTVLRVAPGSEVTIVNRDAFEHPLGRPGGEWSWDGARRGQTTIRLDQAGTYPFFCYVHPGMVGVVVVGDGRGPAASVVDVAASGPSAVAAGPPGQAAASSEPAASGRAVPTFPVAWLVLVAVAALVGAAAGARVRSRGLNHDPG